MKVAVISAIQTYSSRSVCIQQGFRIATSAFGVWRLAWRPLQAGQRFSSLEDAIDTRSSKTKTAVKAIPIFLTVLCIPIPELLARCLDFI
jgi:hypothetical protein